MIKNIIILLLIVAVAFLLISNIDNLRETKQTKTEEPLQTDESAKPSNTNNVETAGKSLDLSNQGLEKLPAYVLKESSLEVLDISNNKLTNALPGEIRHLKNLKTLDASGNDMTGVPAEIGQLENLEILDLSNNKLTGLPYELGNLKNLKRLNLSGNNYSKQDLEIIKNNLPSNTEIIL